MKKTSQMISLFGASGRTGTAIVREASRRSINVRTLSKRSPTMDELRQVIRGTDGVIIVFGPRPPYTDIFCAEATKQIILAMKKERINRLVCQTGAMIGDYPQNRSWFFELFSRQFKSHNPEGYKDRVLQESAVQHSSLDWTIIKPPRLTNSADNKTIQAGTHVKIGLLSSVSRNSLARFIVQELTHPKYMHQIIFIKE